MAPYFHAVAVDYDGTLTREPRPTDAVLAAVRAVRERGTHVLLVTGRIMDELRADFPDVDRHFDAIVAENGAVLVRGAQPARPLAPRVAPALEHALSTRGVPVRAGQVLLAMDGVWDEVVTAEIARLGLECQLMRNRGALMVLPSGVTKGSGLVAALTELGISAHNTVGIGDAENDHSLLDVCEIGVAVENAVPSLKRLADVVLAAPDGAAVAAFLTVPLLEDLRGIEPRRRVVTIGTFADGSPATIPAARVNLAIHGASGSGKSYIAGLIAEQLVAMGYTLCILDLEGDHLAIGELHGVIAAGGRERLPSPEHVGRLLRQGFTSVVIDLSLQHDHAKRSYAASVLEELRRTREERGLPHWIIVDEAHVPMTRELQGWWCGDTGERGFCLVTYRPDLLCPGTAEGVQIILTLGTDGSATIERRGSGDPRPFTSSARATAHIRHWHKYVAGQLPVYRRFYFRDPGGLTGRTAGNIPEFRDEVRRASWATLRHHAAGHELSRWLGDLTSDPATRTAIQTIEEAISACPDSGCAEPLRTRLVTAIEAQLRPR
jgi:hydroxymethylpyrimidine pyrophosphatase-like HAD family hydrolase